MPMKKKLFCVIAILAIALAVGSFAIFRSSPRLGSTEEEFRTSLLAMNKADCFNNVKTSFNANANTPDIGSLTSWAAVLGHREAEFSDDEFLAEIIDTTNAEWLRVTMLQVFAPRYPQGIENANLMAILADTASPETLRTNLVHRMAFETPEAKAILSNIATTETGDIGFNALKKLKSTSTDNADDIELNVLRNYKNEDMLKVRSAIAVLAAKYSNIDGIAPISETATEDKQLLFDVCADLMNTAGQVKSDSAVVALAGMRDIETMRLVINNANVDNIMKTTVVDQNSLTLTQMLENSPTAANIEFAISCLEILPVKDLQAPLETALSTMPQANNAQNALSARANSVLQLIAQENLYANPNWNAKSVGAENSANQSGYACVYPLWLRRFIKANRAIIKYRKKY